MLHRGVFEKTVRGLWACPFWGLFWYTVSLFLGGVCGLCHLSCRSGMCLHFVRFFWFCPQWLPFSFLDCALFSCLPHGKSLLSSTTFCFPLSGMRRLARTLGPAAEQLVTGDACCLPYSTGGGAGIWVPSRKVHSPLYTHHVLLINPKATKQGALGPTPQGTKRSERGRYPQCVQYPCGLRFGCCVWVRRLFVQKMAKRMR